MISDFDRVDVTPRQQSEKHLSYSVTVRRPGSPLKREAHVSRYLASSPSPPLPEHEAEDPATFRRRNTRAYDQTQRWTILAREAEADEVSIVSVTSEERDYLNALVPDVPPPSNNDGLSAGEIAGGIGVESAISGFDEDAFTERESTESMSRDNEVDKQPDENTFDEAIYFTEPVELPDFTPPQDPNSPPTEPSRYDPLIPPIAVVNLRIERNPAAMYTIQSLFQNN